MNDNIVQEQQHQWRRAAGSATAPTAAASASSSAAVQQRRRQLTLGKLLLGSNWAGCGLLHYLSFSETITIVRGLGERSTGRFVSLLWHPFVQICCWRGEFRLGWRKRWKCRHLENGGCAWRWSRKTVAGKDQTTAITVELQPKPKPWEKHKGGRR